MFPQEKNQLIDACAFKVGVLEDCLKLAAPLFFKQGVALRQLRYVEKYAQDLACKSILVESHYIDRDYIEDHSVFYSKNLHNYPNYCRRVHFFGFEEQEVRRRLKELVGIGIRSGQRAYREECLRFSEEAYLGFSVIKPLPGSPVGRTVMRSFPETFLDADGGSVRNFECTRTYTVHLHGVELTVRGLAFQQQDVGVSACATTALWSALQKARDHEDITSVTPAQITSLASRHSLPFGRAMPSEGLSVDQMCQAVQAAGLSPSIFRLERITEARAYLYSAVKSGFAPVLILKQERGSHAVAVAGMKVRTPHVRSPVIEHTDDVAGNLIALYIHDDRQGPYLRANIVPRENDEPYLLIPSREGKSDEAWALTHILVPMHSKIRLSVSGLRVTALHVIAKMHQFRELIDKIQPGAIKNPVLSFECWIARAHKYIESLFVGVPDVLPERIIDLCTRVKMARYVGVVRVSAEYIDPIDILIDTTGTQRNAHCLGVVAPKATAALTDPLARGLARAYRSELVV